MTFKPLISNGNVPDIILIDDIKDSLSYDKSNNLQVLNDMFLSKNFIIVDSRTNTELLKNCISLLPLTNIASIKLDIKSNNYGYVEVNLSFHFEYGELYFITGERVSNYQSMEKTLKSIFSILFKNAIHKRLMLGNQYLLHKPSRAAINTLLDDIQQKSNTKDLVFSNMQRSDLARALNIVKSMNMPTLMVVK